MQLVGRNCQVCGGKITMALDVSGCLHCSLVFHERCIKDGNVEFCPQCGKSFRDQVQELEERHSSRHARRIKQGQVLILATLALLLCAILAEIVLFIDQGVTPGPAHFIRFLLTGLLFVAVYSGHKWARLLLAFLLCLGFLLGLIFLFDPWDTAGMKSMPLYAATAVSGVAFIVIVFVPSVGDYFQHKHGQRVRQKK